MTIKDLFNIAVAKGLEDAEILINYDYWHNLDDVPVTEEILHYDKDRNKIYINL